MVLQTDGHAQCLILRSDGLHRLSFHAGLLNIVGFRAWQLQEDVQQIELPFVVVRAWCCGSIELPDCLIGCCEVEGIREFEPQMIT